MSSSGQFMLDHKSLGVAVMICATLVNKRHTDGQTGRQLLTGYTTSSARWAENCCSTSVGSVHRAGVW